MGYFAKAEPLYKEALETVEKYLGREHPDTATSLNNLANLYWAMGDYAKAEPLVKDALAIRQKVLGREHPDTAQSLNSLALLYLTMGDYTKAEPLFKEALDIDQKVLGREHPDTAQSLRNLGVLYWAMGDYAKAEPLFKEALAIRQKVLGREHPDTAQSLDNIAYLELDLGKFEEAKRLAELADTTNIKVFSHILSFGSEDQRLAYQRFLQPYTLFAVLQDNDALLADAVLHYKGVVLDSILEDGLLAETSKEEASRDLIQQLKNNKRMLAQLSLRTAGTPTQVSERIRALEQEVEDIEGKLVRQIPDFGQARRALKIRVEDVQAALPNDTVIAEYVKYFHYLGKSKFELRYGAVVLSTDTPPRWVPLGNAEEIETALKRYQVLVRRPEDAHDMAALLHQLHDKIWAPIERLLPTRVKTVIISPDGQINFLSFATLLDRDDHFIAEKYSVRYVASSRDLLREFKPTRNDQVVLLANPNFNNRLPDADRSMTSEAAR